MEKKIIFHIDVNSAFLSWEAVYREKFQNENIDLRDISSAIGGDIESRHGIILAKSMLAKRYGVVTGESIIEAKRKCPELLIVSPNHNFYREQSKKFINILKEYSPDVEQYSIDEAFVDMTGTKMLFGEPIEAAHLIKDRIKKELGFTVNVGISSNKLLAKMASDFQKPDMVHTLFPDEIEEKMWVLPVSDLFFVGKSTSEKLLKLGIHTIGELANTDIDIIEANLKKQGKIIWEFANGIDFSIVQTEPTKNKGYGNSTTIGYDVTDADTAKLFLLTLSETVAARLRKDNVKIETVSVTIKDNNLKSVSHQKILEAPTNITNEIYSIACELFNELWDNTPIRLLGIQTSKINDKSDSMRQMSLFDNTNYEKLEKLDEAIDKIRGKYGKDYVKRARLVSNARNKEDLKG